MNETVKISLATSKNGKSKLVEEGRSRITPFEALYLLELGCHQLTLDHQAQCNGDIGTVSTQVRVQIAEALKNLECENPDWHFDDFELWVRKHVHWSKDLEK